MKLWTIQPVEVIDILNRDGIFRCNPLLSDNYCCRCFKDAYDWLVEEMDKRDIPHPDGLTIPIWAWYERNRKHKKPDLRESGYTTRGEKCVCIELEIQDNMVLLSDFDKWHSVLNNFFVSDAETDEEFDKEFDLYESLTTEGKKKMCVDSWQKIFDISKGYGYTQATFWEIRKEMVKKVVYFTAR